jgi:hypothetical protein
MRRFAVIGIMGFVFSGCDIAREVLHPTRYSVSCRDEANKEIASFRCNELSVNQGLVILDKCEDDYKDKAVVLACPVLVVKDNTPKAAQVFDNRNHPRKKASGQHDEETSN